MPKLLIVSSSNFFSSYGGGQVYLKNLVDEFVNMNIYPSIATPYSKESTPREYNGCKIFTFNSTANIDQFQRLISNIKPDIVHAHGSKDRFAKACINLNIPCIVTAHHGGILCPAGSLLNYRDDICNIAAEYRHCLPCVLKTIRWGLASWPVVRVFSTRHLLSIGHLLSKLPFIPYITPVGQASLGIQKKTLEWSTIHNSAQCLIAPSHAIAESMIQNGARRDKIKILPHGIYPPASVSVSKSNLKTQQKAPIKFFYLGRICHEKGVHVMLSAFKRVKASSELHIIGGAESKSENRYMKRLIKQYQCDKRVKWHGKVNYSEIYRHIRHFDCMIHPTICLEVFGLNISEALAMGKPVIASRCGGPETQIKAGENGFLVQPNDVLALSTAIKLLIHNPSLIKRFTDNSQPINFIQNHCIELINLYREIHEKKTCCH